MLTSDRCEEQQRMAVPFGKSRIRREPHRLPVGKALGQPVEYDGDEDDREALFGRLADLQLLQREQQLLAKPRGADQRGDDGHGKRLHYRLVDAEHQGLLRRRDLNLPQQLPVSATGHPPGFHHLVADSPEAEDDATRHRRQREQQRRQHRRHLAEAEQHDDGAEIGHVRGGLENIESGGDDALGGRRPQRPDADGEAEDHRQRHRYDDDRQGLHGIRPETEQRDVEEAAGRQQGEPPAGDPVAEDAEAGDDGDPRQRRYAEIRQAAEQRDLGPVQRIGDDQREEPRQFLDGEQAEARLAAEPGEEVGDPLLRRQHPGVRPDVECGDCVLRKEAGGDDGCERQHEAGPATDGRQ